jgi:hypothetical protein
MKRYGIVLPLLLLTAASLLAASCGSSGSSNASDGGEAEFVSILVDGGGAVVYTETTNTNATAGSSPYLSTHSSGTNPGTYLYSMDWNGTAYDTRFEIHTWSTGVGTYSISGDSSLVMYVPAGGPTYSSMSNIPNASGTITFTEFGPGGGGRSKVPLT